MKDVKGLTVSFSFRKKVPEVCDVTSSAAAATIAYSTAPCVITLLVHRVAFGMEKKGEMEIEIMKCVYDSCKRWRAATVIPCHTPVRTGFAFLTILLTIKFNASHDLK
jgi:hypothetical protein